MTRLRPGRTGLPPPWPGELRLDADLGVDSLERLHVSTALGEALHLEQSALAEPLLGEATLNGWAAAAGRSLDAFSAELTFKTSGSSGQPKWCRHQLADLEDETALHVARFAGALRIVSAVPSHHIYGFLFTLLLPARLGIAVADIRAYAPAQLAAVLEPGDLIIGYPDFWAAFGRARPRVPAGVAGVSSTAPCPPHVAAAAVAAGLTRLVEVYGSSETAGIGVRDDPAAPFELLPVWQRGASESELTRRRAGEAVEAVVAPDRLAWAGDRLLRPAGRAEGAVQVGGINVFPGRVAARLETLPGVAAAAVRLMRPAEGTRLKAFIVPDGSAPDPATLRLRLWAWIDANLSVPERPKSIVFGPRLPTGALGKRIDWSVADDADDTNPVR